MSISNWARTRPFGIVAGLLAIFLLSACGDDDDNNPATPEEEHEEAEGLVITDEDGNLLIQVWEGTASGEIEVEHLETTGTLAVQFLDADSVTFVPELDEGFEMRLAMDDEAIATADSVGHFEFTVTGVEEGMTELTVSIFHEGHSDFDSPALEVHVEEELEVEGLLVSDGGTELVHVWQGNVTGSIDVATGGSTSPLTIEFFTPDSMKFTPDLAEGFEMRLLDLDTAVATADSLGHFQFQVNGVAGGSTSLNVGIFHIDHIDFESPDLPINVITP